LIAGTYRRMALANALLSQGAAPAKIFRRSAHAAVQQGAYLSMLNQIDSGAMAQRMQRIAEADLAIKTSKATTAHAGWKCLFVSDGLDEERTGHPRSQEKDEADRLTIRPHTV